LDPASITDPEAWAGQPSRVDAVVVLGDGPAPSVDAPFVLRWALPSLPARDLRDLLVRRFRLLWAASPTPAPGRDTAAPPAHPGAAWRPDPWASAAWSLALLEAERACLCAERVLGEGAALVRRLSAVEEQVAALEAEHEGLEWPMSRLAARCLLGKHERRALWLALGLALWPERRANLALWGQAQGLRAVHLDQLLGSPGAPLARALWPDAPLRASGLLEPVLPEPAHPLEAAFLPAPHVAAFLCGCRALSPALEGVAQWLRPQLTLADVRLHGFFEAQLRPALGRFWEEDAPRGPWYGASGLDLRPSLGVALRGLPGSGRAFGAKALAGSLGRDVLCLDGAALAASPEPRAEAALRRAFEEAELFGELLLLRDAAPLFAQERAVAWLRRGLASRRVALFACLGVGDAVPDALGGCFALEVSLEAPAALAQEVCWLALPDGHPGPDARDLEALARLGGVSPGQTRDAVQLWGLLGERGGGLAGVLRAQSNRSAGGVAHAEQASARLEDLILPAEARAQVEEIVAAAALRPRVLHEWGLKARLKRGLALTCLFDGEPGTGKTLCAEVIASEMGLRLWRVDLSGIVDKYIGETEKNLTRLFAQAKPDLHVLLFDEADSLFAKRTQQIERSTDRYSNMDINALLQLIERFEGVAVLTTNLKRNLDPAFERRISFKVHFPMPGEEERELLWRRLMPPGAPPDAPPLDYARLATLELSGGGIKNAILRGAYRSAMRGEPPNTSNLLAAGREEVRASGRLVRQDSAEL
jgi:hypothetical protein